MGGTVDCRTRGMRRHGRMRRTPGVSERFAMLREFWIGSLAAIHSCQEKVNRHLGAPCMMVCERCMDRQWL